MTREQASGSYNFTEMLIPSKHRLNRLSQVLISRNSFEKQLLYFMPIPRPIQMSEKRAKRTSLGERAPHEHLRPEQTVENQGPEPSPRYTSEQHAVPHARFGARNHDHEPHRIETDTDLDGS